MTENQQAIRLLRQNHIQLMELSFIKPDDRMLFHAVEKGRKLLEFLYAVEEQAFFDDLEALGAVVKPADMPHQLSLWGG